MPAWTRPPAEASPNAEPEALRFGRYVVLGRIGAGAMGVVYRAYDEALDRRVAVKLLKGHGASDREDRLRLQREAQALAQLSHPNVVQVYDVGEWRGQSFVALEFVEGQTVSAWLAERPRRWTEILDVFIQAGRGLQAAHAAGIVHRDFKPDNVLIGADGRVRVADFGLALPVGNEAEATHESESSQSGGSAARLTVAGALVGTPAYMAPEQFLRHLSDARTDQFAYCAAFFEALFGYRPFTGSTLDEIRLQVLSGAMLTPPTRTLVPPWLSALLLRGLSSDPERRYPSMEALLAELTRDRRKAWRQLAWAGGLAGVVTAFVVQQRADPPCQDAATHLVGAWDPERSAALERAVLATGLARAPELWAELRAGLDDYARGWVTSHTAACLAHQRGEQSNSALDLRMQCLQRRRGELAALVQVLGEVDARTVLNAAPAVQKLPAVAACDDAAALLDQDRRLAAPSDPGVAIQVRALEARLARVEALILAGQVSRAATESGEVLAAAEAAGHPPTLAEALFWRGQSLFQSGAMIEAKDVLRRAYLKALAVDHEAIEARALVSSIFVEGVLGDLAAAERDYQVAAALVSRIGPDTRLAADLLGYIATAKGHAGRFQEAEALLRENLALERRLLPPGHTDTASTLANLATTIAAQDRTAEAEPFAREALGIFRARFGDDHPHTLTAGVNLGLYLFFLHRPDEARQQLERVMPPFMALFEDADRTDLGEPVAALGLLRLTDDPERALADLRLAYTFGERDTRATARSFTRFALAQGLWEARPGERVQALELARAAAEDATSAGTPEVLAEILAWIERHPLPSP